MKKLLFLLIPFIGFAQDRITGELFSTRSEIIAENGMVATSHPLATQIGIDILKQGGNAIDAAIAANAAIGLMEPTGNGIGGDLFAIVWVEKEKKLYGLNASGRSPKNLTLDYFKDNKFEKIPAYGPLPVSVPGCVDGWFELHDRFGKMNMKNVLKGIDNKISGDLLAIDIRQALQHLGELTGEVTNDEVLGNIFSKFCIGK